MSIFDTIAERFRAGQEAAARERQLSHAKAQHAAGKRGWEQNIAKHSRAQNTPIHQEVHAQAAQVAGAKITKPDNPKVKPQQRGMAYHYGFRGSRGLE